MKKIIALIILLFTISLSCNLLSKTEQVVYCEEDTQSALNEEVEKQLTNLDLSDIESIIDNLTEEEKMVFGDSTFWNKLTKLLKGEYTQNTSIFLIIIDLFFSDMLNYVPLIAVIIAISILFSMASQMKSSIKKNAIGDILHFACYGIIIILVMTTVFKMLDLTTSTLEKMNSQMQVVFPILLTMLTAVGGYVSTSVFQPAFALMSSGITLLFSKILLPLFIFSLVFTILSNLSSTIKLNNFSNFFSSLFKWILGCAFTIFFAFISIQGISAGSYDGISFRTAKFAIKSSIPIIGNYLSDGFNLIIASSVLIKNAIGASGLLLLLSTIIIPVINLVIFMFCLKMTSAILEPLTDSKISKFVEGVGKSMGMLIAIILSVAFMYILLTGLVMCTANFS